MRSSRIDDRAGPSRRGRLALSAHLAQLEVRCRAATRRRHGAERDGSRGAFEALTPRYAVPKTVPQLPVQALSFDRDISSEDAAIGTLCTDSAPSGAEPERYIS